MEKTLRISIACFTGALIGSLVALQIGGIGWSIGAVIGAFIAYIGYDAKGFVSSIPKAWKIVSEMKPDYTIMKIRFKSGMGTMGVMQTILCFMIILPFYLEGQPMETIQNLNLLIGMLGVIHFLGFMIGFSVAANLAHLKGYKPQFTYMNSNPIGVTFWTLYGIFWLITKIPMAVVETWKFLCFMTEVLRDFYIFLWREVHSEFRLLCAVDAAIGTAIGYYSGNAIVGAMAGAIFGVLDYEIVSIRLLKVVGAKSIFSRSS